MSGQLPVEIESSSVKELLLWLLRRRRRVRVSGVSMWPRFKPGDELLVDPRAYTQRPPKPGDIVVARHPQSTEMKIVKRVHEITGDGRLFLVGDNPQSSDSSTFGLVERDLLIGRVTSRFHG